MVVGLAFFLTTTPFSPFLISFLAMTGFAFAPGGGGAGGCPVTGGAVALTALVRAATALQNSPAIRYIYRGCRKDLLLEIPDFFSVLFLALPFLFFLFFPDGI